jgi:Family of unknown function (DUF6335)
MAPKKTARRRASTRRPARSRRPVRKPGRKRAKPVARRARTTRKKARKAAPRRRRRAATPARRRPTRRAAAKPTRGAARRPGTRRRGPAAASRPAEPRPPTLQRERRRLPDVERLDTPRTPDSDERLLSSVRAGHDELKAMLARHHESGPRLTGGDIDADWQDAYAVGDEAPGGDNPTPDQDRVDEIGRSLGVQYQDNEELQGGDEITKRDQRRWELDPASSDDWPHEGRPKKKT